jgi:hypothetical protein
MEGPVDIDDFDRPWPVIIDDEIAALERPIDVSAIE